LETISPQQGHYGTITHRGKHIWHDGGMVV
jgi:hypothetical protein